MKKLLTIGSVLLLLIGTSTFAQVDVTFKVDMNVEMGKGNFDATTDAVALRGAMNNWGETAMEDGDGDGVYEVTLSLAPDSYDYKFYHSGGGGTWEEGYFDGNRNVVVADAGVVGPFFFNKLGEYTGVGTTIEFQVDMQLPIRQGKVTPGVTNVYVAGNFTDWGDNAIAMTDDDGDSVYTATVETLTSGEVLYYKFIHSPSDVGSGSWEEGLEGDDVASNGNRIFGVVDSDTEVRRFWENTDPNVELGDGNIFFSVDLTVMEELGIYDPVVDSLELRGNFNSWSTSNPDISRMNQDFLDPNLWQLNIPFVNSEIGGKQFYKFFVNKADTSDIWKDGYERPLSKGGGNRDVAFAGSETQEIGDLFYDDVHPDWVIPEGVTVEITFSVDMGPAMDPGQTAVPFDPAEDELYWINEQPAFTRVMNWVDSDTMKVLQLTDPDADGIYTGTLTVVGPAFNAFEYRYAFKDMSENSWTIETAGFGDFAYRVRYNEMTGARAFVTPYSAPTDTWTDEENKSDQFEDKPAGWTTSVRDLDELAKNFELSQNYPNPFNPSTTIKFKVPVTDIVTLKIYNILGQQVATLINKEMNAGSYEVKFNASELASGVYMYSLEAGSFRATKKMMLLK